MIIDSLEGASKYYGLHRLFSKAFDHLLSLDIGSVKEGRYELENGHLFYMVTDNEGLSKEASTAKFECHNEYIDIQLCIRGKETIGWKPRNTCSSEKDIGLKPDFVYYADTPDMYFDLTERQFAIFFPGDVHAPMIGEGKIKKIVMKVKI